MRNAIKMELTIFGDYNGRGEERVPKVVLKFLDWEAEWVVVSNND